MLIDSHTHLDDSRFDQDREALIESFEKDGIELVINIGADLQSSIRTAALAEKYERIYGTVGVHPHDAKDVDQSTIEILKSFTTREKIVGVGEIGLDYYYDNSPRDIQRKWFREQLKLAKEVDLPVVIHSRDAAQETFDIIKEEQDGSLRGVIHCYSGSVEMAKEYVKLGFYIGIGGTVTFKNAKTVKEVAREIDLENILIETDAPYLTPEPNRGRRNQSAYVRYVAGEIAVLKGISYEKVVETTNRNTKKLFNID